MADYDPNIAQAAWQFCQSAQVLAQEIASYHATWGAILKPRLMKDGDMWCALHGKDIQVGISGWGKTPSHALIAFETAMCRENGTYEYGMKS